jgi:hypothetical protein
MKVLLGVLVWAAATRVPSSDVRVDAGGTILRTTDGGANWTSQSSGTSAPLNGSPSWTPKPGGRWVEEKPFSTPPPVASELEDLNAKVSNDKTDGCHQPHFITRNGPTSA